MIDDPESFKNLSSEHQREVKDALRQLSMAMIYGAIGGEWVSPDRQRAQAVADVFTALLIDNQRRGGTSTAVTTLIDRQDGSTTVSIVLGTRA